MAGCCEGVMASSNSFTSGSRPAKMFQLVSSPMKRSHSATSLARLAASGHGLSGLAKTSFDGNSETSARTSFSGASHSKREQTVSTTQFLDSNAATSTAAVTACNSASHTAYASLSRLFAVSQPSALFRMVSRVPKAGPISLLIVLFGIIAATAMLIRNALARKAKSCSCCKGYGIVRCNLCQGQGTVGWSAKFSYNDGCPMCMAKRYVDCPDCGGFARRGFFSKGVKPPGMPEPQFLKTAQGL